MSDIIDLIDERRQKTTRELLKKEVEYLEYQIKLLEEQKQLVLDYLDKNHLNDKEMDYIEKPPMKHEDIMDIYRDFMKNEYHNKDYTKDE